MTFFGDFVTNTPLTFARMRQLLEDQGGGLQEGVLAAGDLKVSQRAAGGANMSVDVASGAGWIEIDSGTRQGLSHIFSDAIANGVVTNSHATLPRVDRIVIQYNDSSIPAGVGGDVPTLRVIAGVPTAGATLDNETGIAALPNDSMQIGTVLIPAASATVTNANIRDRRKWARGAFFEAVSTAGNQTTASASFVLVASSDVRMECTGNPITMLLRIQWEGSAVGRAQVAPYVDGVQNQPMNTVYTPAAGRGQPGHFSAVLLPAAGSHILDWRAAIVDAMTLTIYRTAGAVMSVGVREDIRQNSSNT